MAKTAPPAEVEIPGVGAVVLNAAPDPFDGRDAAYRARLRPLPDAVDRRPAKGARLVLHQQGHSCVGHAVAAMVNAVLARRRPPVRVSPYMLYTLARRYDEFPDEIDAGSSLRGALKGWYHHGVVREELWPDADSVVDLDAPAVRADAAVHPLGAFYRVNPYRLDDVQSAIDELDVVVASAALHDGWAQPVRLHRDGRRSTVIVRAVDASLLGGHAFALVGYDDIGFLVQNSWGTGWGAGGFATLPYEDWLDSAYDAWVARPGVPRTPFAGGRAAVVATGGQRALGPAPDLRRLAAHVVNLGNDGALSSSGRFASDPAQLTRMVEHMGSWHDMWRSDSQGAPSRIVLYAHGGLTSESAGLAIAQKHLNWWLNNRVYPISFAWQSGEAEVLLDSLVDAVSGRLPAGGLGFDLIEQFDRLVENVARRRITWMWNQMKSNARAASAPGVADAQRLAEPGGARGGTLVADLLANYVDGRPEPVEVHLVGHSAGSIFHGALLHRLVERGLDVRTVALLAPAIRLDEFERDVVPVLEAAKTTPDLSVFMLDQQRELDDSCGVGGTTVYHKSLLYLVSRALERGADGGSAQVEVPLLGMVKFLDERAPSGCTSRQLIEQFRGVVAVAPVAVGSAQRSDSRTHGGFDDDGPTMTSVLARILRADTVTEQMEYRPNAALTGIPSAADRAAGPSSAAPAEEATGTAQAAPVAAAVQPPGDTPLLVLGEAQPNTPEPPVQAEVPVLEVGQAPRTGAAVLDLLLAEGWMPVPPEPVEPASPAGT